MSDGLTDLFDEGAPVVEGVRGTLPSCTKIRVERAPGRVICGAPATHYLHPLIKGGSNLFRCAECMTGEEGRPPRETSWRPVAQLQTG